MKPVGQPKPQYLPPQALKMNTTNIQFGAILPENAYNSNQPQPSTHPQSNIRAAIFTNITKHQPSLSSQKKQLPITDSLSLQAGTSPYPNLSQYDNSVHVITQLANNNKRAPIALGQRKGGNIRK